MKLIQLFQTTIQLFQTIIQQISVFLIIHLLVHPVCGTRAAAHTSLQCNAPGAVALGRDVHFDVPFAANLIALQQFRQAQVDERLLRANAKRTHHEYTVGQQVYILRPRRPGDKAHMMKTGPFPIVQVHTNNNITVQRSQHARERISIRRAVPA